MKLRCTENSIRIRLVKSDLSSLIKHGSRTEEIRLGNDHSFAFSVKLVDESNEPSAILKDNILWISLPRKETLSWAKSDLVGMEYLQMLKPAGQLHILIEKDFPCRTRLDENKEDTFWELADKDAC